MPTDISDNACLSSSEGSALDTVTDSRQSARAEHGRHAARVAQLLQGYDCILVAAHASPDGDALGSSGALVWLLRRMGKRAVLYNATGVPDFLSWMPLPGEPITRMSSIPFKPELLVSLDCGDVWRLGKELAEAMPEFPSINIDHHMGNPNFGSVYNWVDPQMAAVGQMVAGVADAMGEGLDGELGACLYVSLVTDTGSFTHGNTTPAVLRLAARLLENGVDARAIREKLDNQWSLAKVKLWSRMLERIRLERGGELGICTVTMADFVECGAVREDIEGFAEQIRRIRGVRAGLLIREDTPGHCKISLRSSGDDNVLTVAAALGGGGHKNAAGAMLNMRPDAAAKAVLHLLDRQKSFKS